MAIFKNLIDIKTAFYAMGSISNEAKVDYVESSVTINGDKYSIPGDIYSAEFKRNLIIVNGKEYSLKSCNAKSSILNASRTSRLNSAPVKELECVCTEFLCSPHVVSSSIKAIDTTTYKHELQGSYESLLKRGNSIWTTRTTNPVELYVDYADHKDWGVYINRLGRFGTETIGETAFNKVLCSDGTELCDLGVNIGLDTEVHIVVRFLEITAEINRNFLAQDGSVIRKESYVGDTAIYEVKRIGQIG